MEVKEGEDPPRCTRCHYSGKMSSGAMDEINKVRKSAERNRSSVVSFESKNKESLESIKEKLKSLKGKSDENAEFL
jgi:hypothetical protein